MRRSVQVALVAVIVLLLGATTVLYMRYRDTSANLAATRSNEELVRSNYAEAFTALAEIQDSLNAITVGGGRARLTSGNLQSEQRPTEPTRVQALESIGLLNASIQRTKERINRLEGELGRSGTKIAGLQRMITNMKQSVVEKEEQIAQLTTQVESLQTTVTGLETTVQANEQTIAERNLVIEEKTHELGTINYVIGTKKELANSGLIVTKGGVLGVGKTVQLSGRYNDSVFTALDTDQETTVRIPAAKVKVLSPQPTSSYELTVAGNHTELRILDPKEFRKVKHLVIMTT